MLGWGQHRGLEVMKDCSWHLEATVDKSGSELAMPEAGGEAAKALAKYAHSPSARAQCSN